MSDPAALLKNLKPQKDFFVGIDSDGCAFDTMEIKQKECFCPMLIKVYQLQAVSKYARQTWEFVNLYSKWRGVNRFHALIKAFELLAERPEVEARHLKAPDPEPLRRWVEKETKLGNPVLEAKVRESGDPGLAKALKWSLAVNAFIEEMVFGIPPFPYVRESLEKLKPHADMIVVSQTPTPALEREWAEHNIQNFVRAIAGQELGTKTEHIAFATKDRYPKERILMIGDAFGDLKAAKGNQALFFPIIPGQEEVSWKEFFDEGIGRFLKGAFAGDYQNSLLEAFEKCLPERPPWKN